MARFGVVTQVIVDDIEKPDGTIASHHLGGGCYTLAGISLIADGAVICSGIGNDFEALCGNWFRRNRIECCGPEKDTGTTHVKIHYLPDGSRTEELLPGAGSHGLMQTYPADFPVYFKDLEGLYIFKDLDPFYWNSMIEFLEKHSGIVTALELLGSAVVPEKITELQNILKRIKILSVNRVEGRALTGEEAPSKILKSLHEMGAGIVALHCSEDGCYVFNGEVGYHIPAFPVLVEDVTGGGNSFTGAFMAGYCLSKGDILHAGACGNAAASFILEQYGVPNDIISKRRMCQERIEDLKAASIPFSVP